MIYMISKTAGDEETHTYDGGMDERSWFDAIESFGLTMDSMVETTSITGWESHCFRTSETIANGRSGIDGIDGIDVEEINPRHEFYEEVMEYF